MTHAEFVIWFHGYLEISGAKTLGEKELQVVKDHLEKFFTKATPDRNNEKVIVHDSFCQCEICKFMKNNPITVPNPWPMQPYVWPGTDPNWPSGTVLC
jgi:hypothetical protein